VTEDIIVIGAGGFGRETLDVIEAINAAAVEPLWRVLGVVDDAPADIQRERLGARGISLLGGIKEVRNRVSGCYYVVGIGAPDVRSRLSEKLDSWGGRAATLIHPAAVIGSKAAVDAGAIVCSGVQLSTNVRLGAHVHISPGAIIGHDSVVEKFVSVNPGAIISGDVQVGTGALVGAGAVILQGLAIGPGAVVGACACVTHDVGKGKTVIGIPARDRKAF